jgi:hypothetical protein
MNGNNGYSVTPTQYISFYFATDVVQSVTPWSNGDADLLKFLFTATRYHTEIDDTCATKITT